MNKIHIKYGIGIAAGLIIYFLAVKLLGLHENPWLRILNGCIVASGLYFAIKQKKATEKEHFNYYSGARAGIYTGFIGTVIFVIFMAVYMFHLDPAFPEKIMDSWMRDYYQGPGILLFVITVEGVASTVILTLAFMQKFKPAATIPKKNA
ncbi:MAG: DUF4199 domain-containing protein [Sinomicrobium sp.]|nr:DUF4199 domain-containing protein [Sinomicrobium sp.]